MKLQWPRLLEEHAGVQFLAALALVVGLKWHTLLEPPVWDAAMGLFPAALTLSANGFDLLEVLAMPGYLEGGPNTHSASLVTLLTALVLRVTGGGGPTSFMVLHLLHFSAAAYALVVLYSFSKPVLGRVSTPLFCLAALLFPLFSVQVGHLYLEVPLFLCAVSALHAWTDGRFWPAVLWATAALAVKETGIIVPATLGVAALLEDREARLKVKRMALVMAPPFLLAISTWLLTRMAAAGSPDAPRTPSLEDLLQGLPHYLDRFLLNVPDLLVFIAVFVVAVSVFGPRVFRTLRSEPTASEDRDPQSRAQLVLGYSGMLIVLFFLLFLVALPVLFEFTIVLPRYYAVIAPFLLLWLGYAVERALSPRLPSATPICFVLLSAFFAVNSSGALYPLDIDTEGPGNDPPLTERSNAYRRLLALEIQAVRALQELPEGTPVYYGHYEHYLFNYAGLGFANTPLSNGHNFWVESLAELIREEPMPPCIYALYNYPWLGGEKIRGLIGYADVDDDLSGEIVEEFRDGRYSLVLARIQKDGAVCPR